MTGEKFRPIRLYAPRLPGAGLSGCTIELDRDQSHHVRRVLRLQLGDVIELFDGFGRIGRGVIEKWTQGAQIRLSMVSDVAPLTPAIEIATAIPKGPRADTMVEQLNQLGVARLIPLLTTHSVVDPRPAKLQRFARVAAESAKQCGGPFIMQISEPSTVEQVVQLGYDTLLITQPGIEVLPDLAAKLTTVKRVLILIGPEGGWTDQEFQQVERTGGRPWSVGPQVLRVETAAAVAAAVARYLAGWAQPG